MRIMKSDVCPTQCSMPDSLSEAKRNRSPPRTLAQSANDQRRWERHAALKEVRSCTSTLFTCPACRTQPTGRSKRVQSRKTRKSPSLLHSFIPILPSHHAHVSHPLIDPSRSSMYMIFPLSPWLSRSFPSQPSPQAAGPGMLEPKRPSSRRIRCPPPPNY